MYFPASLVLVSVLVVVILIALLVRECYRIRYALNKISQMQHSLSRYAGMILATQVMLGGSHPITSAFFVLLEEKDVEVVVEGDDQLSVITITPKSGSTRDFLYLQGFFEELFCHISMTVLYSGVAGVLAVHPIGFEQHGDNKTYFWKASPVSSLRLKVHEKEKEIILWYTHTKQGMTKDQLPKEILMSLKNQEGNHIYL